MTRLTICLLCIPMFLPASASAGDKPLPPDLAFVPPNCAGFIHFRVQDIWKSEHAKEWRDTVMKAGDEALKTLDLKFFPNLSSVERATIMFTMPDQRNQRFDQPDVILILACSKPIDRQAFLKQSLPGAKEVVEKGKKLFVDGSRNREIYFVDDKTVAVCFGSTRSYYDSETQSMKTSTGSMSKIVAGPRDAKGLLSDALNLANSGKPIVAALNHDVIPAQVVRLLPPEYHAVFKFKLAVGAIDFEKEGHVDVRLTYNSAGEASSAELSAKEGISLARSFLEKERAAMEREIFADGQPGILDELPKAAVSLIALGFINKADDYLTKLPIKTSGNALTLSLKMPEGTRMFLASGAVSTAVGWLMIGRDSVSPPSLPPSKVGTTPAPPRETKEEKKKN